MGQSGMELFFLAVALAMDAVAISIIIGSQDKALKRKDFLVVAFFFGFFQAFMPLLGYYGVSYFSDTLSQYSNIIGSIILLYLGINMIKEAIERDEDEELSHASLKELLVLSIATSIDALAVGVTFSFKLVSIFWVVSIIGIVTFFLSFIGLYVGQKVGSYLQDKAEYFGGVILIILGLSMLFG